jgi:hypothetical protein
MEPVDRRGRRTPDATVLQLVPHATSRELLLLLQHCDIDGGGDGSVSRGRGDGRVTSGLREKERGENTTRRARGVWSLVSPTATIQAVMGCEFSSSSYCASGPGESAKCPQPPPLPDLGSESRKAAGCCRAGTFGLGVCGPGGTVC